MRKLIFVIAGFYFAAVSAKANDIYIAQNATGAANGADCADAYAVSFFNTSGNWGTGSSQIGPGTTVHLCGAIISGLTVLGNGTLGNVITVKWETGARVSVPDNGIINLNGAAAYLLFDGGVACGPGTSCDTTEAANMTGYASGQAGIVEATANGSTLANINATTQAFYGCNACHDIEIRNLIIRNLYQHTLASDDSNGNIHTGNWVFQYPFGATGAAGTISIHDSTIHDVGTFVSIQRGLNTTFQFYNLDISRFNWTMEDSGNGSRTFYFHDNHIHDTANWDTASDSYHHAGIHNYMNVASDSLGYYFYNNLSDGNWGSCCAQTLLMYTEVVHPANSYIFNNVAIQSCAGGVVAGGFGDLNITSESQAPSYYNNTLLGCATTVNSNAAFSLDGPNTHFENNTIQGFGQYIVTNSTVTFAALDYNVYGAPGTSGNPPWQCNSTGTSSFATWKTACGEGSHSQNVSNINVNSSTGTLNSGSALIGAGANLTSFGITALDTDKAGTPRPTSTAWDVGAYYSGGSSASAPNPPTGLLAAVN